MSTVTITDDERRRRLAVRHHLAASQRADDVAQVVDDLVAVHSSDPATVYLSLCARMRDPSIEAVEAALYDERSVVRHHAMRRTMWVMTPEVARQAHASTTAKLAAGERKRTLSAIVDAPGIDDPAAWFDAAADEIRAHLAAHGELSTRQIGQALPHLAVKLEFGSAKHSAMVSGHSKVLQGAGFEGLLVRTRPTGSWISAEYRWIDAESWLGEPLAGGELQASAAGLVRRWLERFGPATEEDIAWWSGWTLTQVRRALADIGATPAKLEDGSDAWLAPDDADETDETPDPGPWVRLLPGLDATTMGWKGRDWYLDPAMTSQLLDRFGNAGPTIWADGRIVGSWAQRPDASVVYELLAPVSKKHQKLLADAVAEVESLVGDTVVKPRFPAPIQKQLLA